MSVWENSIAVPFDGRTSKPRTQGYTMVLDSGLGLASANDMVSTAGDYIDNVQFTFGSSVLYPDGVLEEKIELFRSANIGLTPGGGLLQVAIWQGKQKEFLKRAKILGFSTVELFDSMLNLDAAARERVVKSALDEGFEVITEVLRSPTGNDEMHKTIALDLKAGAAMVIVPFVEGEVEDMLAGNAGVQDLLWEPPATESERHLADVLVRCGGNANVILRDPSAIISLETLRVGLKGRTMAEAHRERPVWD